MVKTGKIIWGVVAAAILTGVCMNQSIYAEEKSRDDIIFSEVPMTVFFEGGTSEEEILKIKEKIEEMPETRKVEYISSDETWTEFKNQYFGGTDSTEANEDPLTNSANLSVYAYDADSLRNLISYIEGMDRVWEVEYSEELLDNFSGMEQLFTMGGETDATEVEAERGTVYDSFYIYEYEENSEALQNLKTGGEIITVNGEKTGKYVISVKDNYVLAVEVPLEIADEFHEQEENP